VNSDRIATEINDILKSVQILPAAAKSPILHYRKTIGELFGLLGYVGRMVSERVRYKKVIDRHTGRLHGMVLVNLIETFERYLEEVAAECIDSLAELVIDDRFDIFNKIQGSNPASHFRAGTVGKALCEYATWLDCDEINERFRKILTDPFVAGGTFYTFPKTGNQEPKSEHWRYDVMSLVWQMRHTSVHNVGVITQSDAVKMRVLAKMPIAAPRMLMPSRNDIVSLKQFLDDTAEDCNRRIGARLAALLTTIHAATPALVDPQSTADKISTAFQIPLAVATVAGTIAPD